MTKLDRAFETVESHLRGCGQCFQEVIALSINGLCLPPMIQSTDVDALRTKLREMDSPKLCAEGGVLMMSLIDAYRETEHPHEFRPSTDTTFRPFVVQQEETDMPDQPSNPTWPGTGPTPPQPHPATGVPEQNPRRIGPATGKPSK